MIELYQFELSHYCEKIRFILDYKGLDYKKVEVTPGVGQFDLFQLSGQRQVPVLKDGSTIIADSTAIARYLDTTYPDRPIIPTDLKQRALCLLMEEWADESIGLKGRAAMIGAFNTDPALRRAIVPTSLPSVVKDLASAVPGDVLNILTAGIGFGADAAKSARDGLKQNLEALSLLLVDQPYLVGETPTLADFAVAGLSMYIKFPTGNYLDIPTALKGQGVSSLINDSSYAPFWAWRDRLYTEVRKPIVSGTAGVAKSETGPTRIAID